MVTEKAATPKEKTELAVKLADSLDRNPLAIAAIVHEMSTDKEALSELGFRSLKEWGVATFGRKWKSICGWSNVHKYLVVNCGYRPDHVAEIGIVKAQLLTRLPESQVREVEWGQASVALSTSDFKAKVLAFLDKSPDWREGWTKISFDSPKSFKDETWSRVIALGKQVEETDETHIVVEAALANYEQEIDAAQISQAVTDQDPAAGGGDQA